MANNCPKCGVAFSDDVIELEFSLCPGCTRAAHATVDCPMETHDCDECKGSGEVTITVGGSYASGRPAEDREVKCKACDGTGKRELEACCWGAKKGCAPDGVTCPAREAARSVSEAYARERVAPI